MLPLVQASSRHLRWPAALGLPALVLAGTGIGLVATASPALAGPTTLYAYAGAATAGLTTCPKTNANSARCTLAEALGLAKPGTTVALVTPAIKGSYVGNWAVGASSKATAAAITIQPAPGVARAILDGNLGKLTHCQTSTCNGPVLSINAGAHVNLNHITIQRGDNTTTGDGGGIFNAGTLVVNGSMFVDNTALYDGGAIDSADHGGGTLEITGSSFSGNVATYDGGAINSADNAGTGTVTVSGSTFSGNSVTKGDGGAIDSTDHGGKGSLTITTSTFSGSKAGNAGGALDNGDGTLAVTSSTFVSNTTVYDGGAIDSADHAVKGSLTVFTSTFSGNSSTKGDGGAIDNAGRGTVTIVASTFSGNTALYNGATIDNADNAGAGAVWVAGDLFSGTCTEGTGIWDDAGYNVGSDGTCLKGGTGDVGQGASLLGPLAHNGGLTLTILPQPTNPAVGAIPVGATASLSARTVPLCPTTDQRGVHSPAGQHCNAGAVQ